MNRLKVLQLEKTFKLPKNSLFGDEDRLLKFEETMTLLLNNAE